MNVKGWWNGNSQCAEFIFGNIKMYLYFLSFLNNEMVQVVKFLCCGRQGHVYLGWSIPWLLMSWWRKEPGHQQSWYWPISPMAELTWNIPVLAQGGLVLNVQYFLQYQSAFHIILCHCLYCTHQSENSSCLRTANVVLFICKTNAK